MTTKPRGLAGDIIDAVREGTKQWTRTVKAEERNPSSREYRESRMTRERGLSFKEAAAQIMERAYMATSGNEELPANARQIMYKARPHIQEATGRKLNPDYFTQNLLPKYVAENDLDWDVIYDARGHFTEPHDGERFGLGTLEVRDYLAELHDPSVIDAALSQAKVETKGPSGNFGAVLFIEKEGFDPILEAAEIDKRSDVAIMSPKGMSSTAARKLADEMCSTYKIPLLVLHDFDKAGFSIAGTLQRDTDRYEFQNDIDVRDLGLSLADVEAMGLEAEYQHLPKISRRALEQNLRTNGATSAEIAFMLRDFDRLRSLRRVELNAMTSPQFIEFVERKLRENGITKIIPNRNLLAKAYRGMERGRLLSQAVAKLPEIKKDNIEAPKDLEQRIKQILQDHPAMRWDAAVRLVLDERGGG